MVDLISSRHDTSSIPSDELCTFPADSRATEATLRITEIYPSIQGESLYAGFPCLFIRLTGCPLRCRWCDTVYGFTGGTEKSLDKIIEEVRTHGLPLVELTGGEPLAQANARPLMARLVAEGYRLLIETSGSETIAGIDPAVHIIMDIKCPDSGMADRNLWDNLAHLKHTDEIKLVIASRSDFDWAIAQITDRKLNELAKVSFSPAFGLVKPDELVAWMLADAPKDIRLNMQLHKYIWHPRKKGV